MNFSTLQGLTIPEGVVTQIADASGRVIWSAVEPVTITLSGIGRNSGCYIMHNGTRYYDATQTPSFEANVGDVIYCSIAESYNRSSVYLNGTRVITAKQDDVEYYYTVASNAMITFEYSTNDKIIRITEIPEGQILFTIDSTNYFADEGMTWAEWVESEYNTGGYTNKTSSYGNVVLFGSVGVAGVKTATSVVVQQSDVIISNHSYIHGVVASQGSND